MICADLKLDIKLHLFSSAAVYITQPYCIYFIKIRFSFQLPEQILEASAGFSQEISLSKATRQCVDEEMSWGVDAHVEVQPKSTANVQVSSLWF